MTPASRRVNGQHRCTLAHSYTGPPSCPVCIVFLLLSSVFYEGNSLCFLLSQRPLRFYPGPTCPAPCCERASANLGKTWVNIREKELWRPPPPHAHPYSPAYPTDSFSSSRCKEKPAGWSNVFRFCEHAQDVYSCHAGLQLRHALLPPPPPAAAEAVQLQPATFNLAECSRHLNYLTVVLVQGGGRRG